MEGFQFVFLLWVHTTTQRDANLMVITYMWQAIGIKKIKKIKRLKIKELWMCAVTVNYNKAISKHHNNKHRGSLTIYGPVVTMFVLFGFHFMRTILKYTTNRVIPLKGEIYRKLPTDFTILDSLRVSTCNILWKSHYYTVSTSDVRPSCLEPSLMHTYPITPQKKIKPEST